MFRDIISVFIYLFVLLYPPYYLARECFKTCVRRKRLTIAEELRCVIPFYNLKVTWDCFYRSSKILTFGFILTGATLGFRIVAITIFYKSNLMMLISVICSLVCIAAVWALNAYVFFDVASLTRRSFFIKLLCIVAPPLGGYLVAKNVGRFMKSHKDAAEGTFDA